MEDVFSKDDGRGRPPIHPFATMGVGDVVMVSENTARMQIYSHVYGRSADKKFKTRTRDGVLYVKRIK